MPTESQKPEKYTVYKNRVFAKYLAKINSSIENIRQSSLKKEDKVKLTKDLIAQLNSTI